MTCVGGLDRHAQEAALRLGPDVVIATPGRLIDHLHNAPNFNLNSIEVLILDEADRYGIIQDICVPVKNQLSKNLWQNIKQKMTTL